jgi:hypothetical protein
MESNYIGHTPESEMNELSKAELIERLTAVQNELEREKRKGFFNFGMGRPIDFSKRPTPWNGA